MKTPSIANTVKIALVTIALALCLYLSQTLLTEKEKPTIQQQTDVSKHQTQLPELPKPVSTAIAPPIENITHAQIKPMQIKQRPKWKLTGDIKAQLKQLQTATAKGDHRAGYRLAMNYKYCYTAASDEKQLAEKLQQADDFADSGKAINRIEQKYQYCQSISLTQRQTYIDQLIDAANNGQVAAQEVIGTITPEQYMQLQNSQNLERNQYIAKRDQFIEQKLQLLENAAHHGSIKALMKLSNMQHSQNYGPNGYTKAYAYNQIILELTEDNDVHNRYSWFQQKMFDQLDPQEIEQALEITETWLDKIRRNGTIYRHSSM